MQRSKLWWDRWFLELAKYISTASKDPSTRVGAVIVRPDKTVVSFGYNGFPRGIADTKKRLNTRELKYKYVVHAELNAILNATEDLTECTLYTPIFPCERCAVHIIQTGIERIVSYIPHYENGNVVNFRWEESWKTAKSMFKEVGIEITMIKEK